MAAAGTPAARFADIPYSSHRPIDDQETVASYIHLKRVSRRELWQ
jgi:hypothetical protein